MASNAAFTVVDSATDNHVFSPSGIDGTVASYQNLAEVMHSGRETVRVSYKDGKTVREILVSSRMPHVVETTVNGVTRRTVEDFGTGTTKFLVPPSWTPTMIAKLRSTHAALLAAAVVQALADNGEFVW